MKTGLCPYTNTISNQNLLAIHDLLYETFVVEDKETLFYLVVSNSVPLSLEQDFDFSTDNSGFLNRPDQVENWWGLTLLGNGISSFVLCQWDDDYTLVAALIVSFFLIYFK